MKKIAVIGAGAAGLACATALQNENFEVMVFEQFDKTAKKVLASGNGRCNISNEDMNISFYNTQNSIIESIIMNFNVHRFFNQLGLMIQKNGTLLYPYSNQAISVKDVLMPKAKNIKILKETKVNKIKIGKKYTIETSLGNYEVDYVILAMGSKASKLSGEDNLECLEQFDLKIESLNPSLVPFELKKSYRKLKGVRVKAEVSLLVNQNVIATRQGEVQFNDGTISGICVMQLSRYYHQYHHQNVVVKLDLLPHLNEKEVETLLNQRKKQFGHYYLEAIFNHKLAEVLNENKIDLKNLQFEIKDVKSSQFAQVMQGGISLEEIDNSLQLKKYNGVYVIGEILDVDGDCGGYNLHFAFASGVHVAKSIIDKEKLNVKN